ncbi:DUF4377 domain-containing protein [Gaoshiqia sp. Z1-71]|uniref:DUF4377 domain-containing protein n=1 Tax=Gaoshiqia hydrogeniformans TaxID=3290090 RepID=UPI003BF91159
MKKPNLLFTFVLVGVFFTGCLKESNGDKEKIVEMTIYEETGYGASVLSDILTEPLLFSDSDDNQKRMLVDILTEGFDFDYERGYEYTLNVKKIWMKEPPQDVSSVKYVFIGLLSKKKVITEDREEEMELFVSPETVKFIPRYPIEYEEVEGNQVPKIYDALHVKKTGTNSWMALTAIEGFDFENDYEYRLTVKKITQAEPYLVRYILLDVLSKEIS